MEGGDLDQQNNDFVSDMGTKKAAIEEAQAQVNYYEQHLQKTTKQVLSSLHHTEACKHDEHTGSVWACPALLLPRFSCLCLVP